MNIHNFLKICGLQPQSEQFVHLKKPRSQSDLSQHQLELLTSVEYTALSSSQNSYILELQT